jgi:hypothetical protein
MRATLEFTLNGEVVVNVYHVTSDVPIVSIDLINVATILRDWWANNMLEAISSDMGLDRVTVTDVSQENGEQYILDVTPSIPGISPLPSNANQVALVMSWRTAQTGRSYRGRSYIAGLPDAAITDNNVTGILAAYVTDAGVQLIDDMFLAGYHLVVASYYSNGTPRVIAAATEIDTVLVNTRIDTQRRRLPTSS